MWGDEHISRSKSEVASPIRLKVVLTKHAVRRLNERFFVKDQFQIESVFKCAVDGGFMFSNDDGTGEKLIEYGCLLVAGEFDGNGTFTVEEVYNLSHGISDRLKERMREGRPAPWESSKIVLPRENRGDVL
ncbi:hypothetical protein AKJ58_00610 [candidate division MSBL1 archaeon SCGC-AAA385D11]|uniref:Uncharacterized protein n=1 Tax=candidate division MSBL1 archaeon SCGC-AAA385D11 TaxID=1698286 RepID=A0A133VP15_9EURY|nr:hypothetical protein AKJ58_00610 [candidate division MSBL1 archaeon SCGC-AAA385D11]